MYCYFFYAATFLFSRIGFFVLFFLFVLCTLSFTPFRRSMSTQRFYFKNEKPLPWPILYIFYETFRFVLWIQITIYYIFFGFVNLIIVTNINVNWTECIYEYCFVCGITTFKFSLGTDAIIAFLAGNMTYHFHRILQ